MPNDYYANKVVFGDTTIMDISDTTASPEDVAEGEIFYAANGARSVGTGAGGGYVLPVASANTLGGIKVGSNLSIDNNGVLSADSAGYVEGDGITIENNTISLDIEYLTASRLGVVSDDEKGANGGVATLDENGKLSNSQLSTASANVLGGIKVGNGLSIDGNGVLSADGGSSDIQIAQLSQSAYDALPDSSKKDSSKIYFIGESVSIFEQMTWGGLTSFSGEYIWTDGTNTYYSDGSTVNYALFGDIWYPGTWSGSNQPTIYGQHVWTDGTNTYYSNDYDQYKFNVNTWESMTWTGLTSFSGQQIWTDGTDIYYSYYSNQYKLNGTTWESMTWNKSSFVGQFIWTDGTNIYYSNDSSQWVLNNGSWEDMTWSGQSYLSGNRIWTDGTNTYYSYGYNQYKLNGTTWESMSWSGLTYFQGYDIWTDGTNIYYSYGSSQYKLKRFNTDGIYYINNNYSKLPTAVEVGAIPVTQMGVAYGVATLDYNGKIPTNELPNCAQAIELSQDQYNNLYQGDKTDPAKIYFINGQEPWRGLTSFYGRRVWTDGVNTYHSDGYSQYKLNGTTWETMTWSGFTDFSGEYVWTDGTNVYYSNSSIQYKLNGTTWERMTWGGNQYFYGNDIWTDGTNIYCSYGEYDQYKLNGTTWEDMTWSGYSDLYGSNIWTDGTNIYYSDGEYQYVLNDTTWESKSWSMYPSLDLYGSNIWTDGTNIYSSDGEYQYKFYYRNYWAPISWSGLTNFYANDIWRHGANTYYSYGTSQYVLNGTTWVSPPIPNENGRRIYYIDNNYIKSPYELPTASASTLGGVKVGSGLSIDANGVLSSTGGGGSTYTAGDGIDIENATISLDIDYLTASRLGVISDDEKGVNNGVATLDNSGKVPTSQLPSTEIPVASANVLGGIKVGTNLSIDNNGVLSATGGGGSSAWGNIIGTLSDQTDLNSELNNKFDIRNIRSSSIGDNDTIPYATYDDSAKYRIPFGALRQYATSSVCQLIRKTVGFTAKNYADVAKTIIGVDAYGNVNTKKATLVIECDQDMRGYRISMDTLVMNNFSLIRVADTESYPLPMLVSWDDIESYEIPSVYPKGNSVNYLVFEFTKSTDISISDIEALELMVTDSGVTDYEYEPAHITVEEEINKKISGNWHTWEISNVTYDKIVLAEGNTTAVFPNVNDDCAYNPYIQCAKGVSPPLITDMYITANNECIVTFTAVTSSQVGSGQTSACSIKLLSIGV